MNVEINNNKVVFFIIKTANYINNNNNNIYFYNFFSISFEFNRNYGTVFIIICNPFFVQ